MLDTDQVPDEHEREILAEWRIEQFRRLGYLYPAALELAQARVDHHELERLIERGCSLDDARRILL